jgi:hypothetical protein
MCLRMRLSSYIQSNMEMIMPNVILKDIGKMSDAEILIPLFLSDRYFAEKFMEI